jgi:ribosome-associated protein
VLLIEARRYRSQQQNRQDAIERLVGLIARSAQAPKRRKATRPSAASREKRLIMKKQRSEVKRWRRSEGES